jgi:hypothetical protein
MSIFEYISVTIAIVLGLAIARLLTAFGELIIHRKRVTFHWVPLTWAITLFLLIYVLWWQFFSVGAALDEWAFLDFLSAAVVTLPLYLASMLFLPRHFDTPEISLYDNFIRNGKWGVGAYLVFFVLAVPVNARLWDTPVISMNTLQILIAIGTLLGVILSRSAGGIAMWTCGFVVIQLISFFYVIFPAY